MPQLDDFSEDIDVPGSFRSQFVQLKTKGEKIKFRIADKPFYIGRHWISERETVNCPRVNTGDKEAPCQWCEKAEAGEENPNHRSGSYRATLQFYYPIINRQTQEAQLFQTASQVHFQVKQAADAGINVYQSDWQVTRNEGSPATYYGVVRLDQTPLTADEKKEATKIKDMVERLKASLEGRESSMAAPKVAESVSEEPGEEEDLLDDLPV